MHSFVHSFIRLIYFIVYGGESGSNGKRTSQLIYLEKHWPSHNGKTNVREMNYGNMLEGFLNTTKANEKVQSFLWIFKSCLGCLADVWAYVGGIWYNQSLLQSYLGWSKRHCALWLLELEVVIESTFILRIPPRVTCPENFRFHGKILEKL